MPITARKRYSIHAPRRLYTCVCGFGCVSVPSSLVERFWEREIVKSIQRFARDVYEQCIVKEIVYLFEVEKFGAGKIINELESFGFLTKAGSANWNHNGIYKIIDNPIYTGLQVQHLSRMIVAVDGEPKIRLVSAPPSKGRKRHSTKHVFSNLLVCGNCGSALHRKKRDTKILSYSWGCSLYNQKGKKGCKVSV